MTLRHATLLAAALALPSPLLAQAAAPRTAVPMPPRPPQSPEILPDGRVTFRIPAPEAHRVTLTGDVGEGLPAGALPPADHAASPFGVHTTLTLARDANGVWSGTTPAPVRPGAYRYALNVDGVETVDQANMLTSPSQTHVQSLLVVPGDFSEERAVPHGALSQIAYEPARYGGVGRTLWVYTPPGYERSTERYPVLYLIHGGGDTAATWATAGRANFIMDNLIAEGSSVPFIIVMVQGWTPLGPQHETIDAAADPFDAELTGDIIPLVEARFRVKADPAHRALSGLSMGGYQTLTVGMKNLDRFDYVMPMSTGWFTDADRAAFVAANRDALRRADRQLKLFRWGWGTADIARANGLASMAALRAAGLTRIETIEVPGGHQWSTWRQLLRDYAPRMFR